MNLLPKYGSGVDMPTLYGLVVVELRTEDIEPFLRRSFEKVLLKNEEVRLCGKDEYQGRHGESGGTDFDGHDALSAWWAFHHGWFVRRVGRAGRQSRRCSWPSTK